MNREIFTDEELDYINNGAFDKTKSIYVIAHNSKCNGIYAKLPVGHYSLTIPGIIASRMCANNLRKHGVDVREVINGDILIAVDKPTEIYISYFPGDAVANVVSLRRQVIAKRRSKECLISKDIKSRTNHGEKYNRESFYDTIDECLMSGEDLVVDTSKPVLGDEDKRYLHIMRLLQIESQIAQQRSKLAKQSEENQKQLNDLLQR